MSLGMISYPLSEYSFFLFSPNSFFSTEQAYVILISSFNL